MSRGGGQAGQPDDSMGILWIIAAILIFGVLIWCVFKKQIITFYFKIKLLELSIIGLFTSRVEDVRYVILAANPSNLTFTQVMQVGDVVGSYLRIPFLLLLLVLGFMVYFANSTRVFKKIYSMKELANLEKVNWPQITPVLNLDLVKTDIDKGPWAMALTPMQFCKQYKLLEEHKPQPKEGMTRKEWNRIEVTVKRGQASKIFALQIGPMWQGTQKLPPHTRALFAVFAARIQNDTEAAMKLLESINLSYATKLSFAGTDELLQKHENTKAVQTILQSHSYVLTVMASMLEGAREDGVQASADFLWLKPVDRRLWYMLNTVGRQTPFVEVAGPFAHWIAEKEIGRQLILPMVDEATNALEKAIKDMIYKPDET